MNILTLDKISKSYSDKLLFEDIDLTILQNEKIALVGINGTGKSTLLKIIAGKELADTGEITSMRDIKIEYLPQTISYNENSTILEYIFAGEHPHMVLLRKYELILNKLRYKPEDIQSQENLLKITEKMDREDIWNLESNAKAILSKLGVRNYYKKMGDLSGGERRRVFLAGSLIHPSDLLILDEPTNHLDDSMIRYLEEYLQMRKGATLMVTHDRYFLDRVASRIIELDGGKLYSYNGNYSEFLRQKDERQSYMQNVEYKRQRLYKQELEWINTMPRARGTKQKARIDRFERISKESINIDKNQVEISVGARRIGRKIINLESVSKSYGELNLIEDYSYIIQKDDRIGIVGRNGSGKTTLLNIISGTISPDSGKVDIGETIKIGYFTQEAVDMDSSYRVIDYIKETAEYIYTKDGTSITAAQMLEKFLFPKKIQYSYISRLSGGEKKRLYLLKILMESPNVLLLDEPTNDLDIETLTVLEEYINEFNGPVITVSHDRYFLDKIANKILVTKGNGEVKEYYGNYSDYYNQIKGKEEEGIIKVKKPKRPEPKNKIKFSYKEQMEFKEIDSVIEDLEFKITQIDNTMLESTSDFLLLEELAKEKEILEDDLDRAMDRWLYLNELYEKIQRDKKK